LVSKWRPQLLEVWTILINESSFTTKLKRQFCWIHGEITTMANPCPKVKDHLMRHQRAWRNSSLCEPSFGKSWLRWQRESLHMLLAEQYEWMEKYVKNKVK
jgi:hypothetical protein